MTEEFDEDVVFENSPLFQYLQDLGHTDFESCPTASQEEEYGGAEGDLGSPECLWRLVEALRRWSPLHQAADSHKLDQQLDSIFGQYSVRCILDQDVLLQEDVELIELLDPSLLTLGSSPSGSPSRVSSLPRQSLVSTPSLWDVAGLLGLAAMLLGVCCSPDSLWSLAAAPWALALLGWVALRGLVLWRRRRMQKDVQTRATRLQTLVHNSKTLTGLARKALRLVQETEVISRGFTLVSAASSFSRAGPGAVPRSQQLMGLRKVLYRALRSAFRASRRATCHMLKVDNVTNYVCAVPLKELGLGLGIEHLGDEQAQELTDDYSLPALKMLFQLWLGQSSECFRRLALLLSLHRTAESEEEPLHHALASCLGDVQRSYDFHRHFEMQPRTMSADRSGRAREKCRELNTLHTSIRSLQLHLKTLLSEMIILEDDLEKLMVSKELTELTLEGYQDLSERLQQLQPHMQASAGCWEDTVCQVERMLRRRPLCPGNADDMVQFAPLVPELPAAPPSYPLILDRDPVPEEMELEAYVSDSDSDGEGRGSWSDVLSPEERERQRREREESRRVLSELKAVLGFRASEGERMKRKQLLFSDQAAALPLVLTQSPDAAAPGPVGAAGIGSEEGNYLSEWPAGNNGEQWEGKDDRVRPDPVTEFSCGSEESEMGGPSVGGGASELHQYDGVTEEEEERRNGLDCFLKPKIPAVSVLDRLTEIHGSETLSFSSALAAQVAARSQSLANREEQTFGDEEEEQEEEGGENSRTSEKD
uniref:Vezatin n=1 Tax=Xiphophorus couchianus TaxID=32473 RepID=A0A3B5MEV1_9TELE